MENWSLFITSDALLYSSCTEATAWVQLLNSFFIHECIHFVLFISSLLRFFSLNKHYFSILTSQISMSYLSDCSKSRSSNALLCPSIKDVIRLTFVCYLWPNVFKVWDFTSLLYMKLLYMHWVSITYYATKSWRRNTPMDLFVNLHRRICNGIYTSTRK